VTAKVKVLLFLMSVEEEIPQSVARYSNTSGRYLTKESYMNGFNFKPGPTDIVISTAAKAGTTVMQQVRVILGVLHSIIRSLI